MLHGFSCLHLPNKDCWHAPTHPACPVTSGDWTQIFKHFPEWSPCPIFMPISFSLNSIIPWSVWLNPACKAHCKQLNTIELYEQNLYNHFPIVVCDNCFHMFTITNSIVRLQPLNIRFTFLSSSFHWQSSELGASLPAFSTILDIIILKNPKQLW